MIILLKTQPLIAMEQERKQEEKEKIAKEQSTYFFH